MEKLDANRVGESLKKWIPYAEIWGMVDEDLGDFTLEKRTEKEFMDLLRFYWKENEENGQPLSQAINATYKEDSRLALDIPEYEALSWLWTKLNEVHSTMTIHELNRYLGLRNLGGEKTAFGENIERYLFEDLTLDANDHTITLKFWLKLKKKDNLPFQIRLLRCHFANFKMVNGIGEIDGHQNVYGIVLRTSSREFVFPEVRHCYIDTSRFLLEAEYEDVEIIKDW
jgi:hypothetical protein